MDQLQLMRAIAAGRVTQRGSGVQGRTYDLDGQLITYMELRRLAKLDLIDLPLGGPPTTAPDGERWLREHTD